MGYTMSNLIAVGQKVRAYIVYPPEIWAHRLLSFKGIGTDTDLSGTYDFLLTLRNNFGPILYRFQDIARY